MDAFYASVEQRDNPKWRGKPLVVGGNPNSRSVVAACSYEARKFGIHSAMSCSKAYRLQPATIFVKPRFEVYREVSATVHEIFRRYSQQIEPLSLDEAYLDVSNSGLFNGYATQIARAIKAQILIHTNLVASAGVSYNKFLAKIASDLNKPNGLCVITPEQGADFVSGLAVGKFHGVGPVTEAKMHKMGIKTGGDLRAFNLADLTASFGKSANYYYHIARGIDHRPVQSIRIRKSLGKEVTFAADVLDHAIITQQLHDLADSVLQLLASKKLYAKTVTLKIRYANFQQITRAFTANGNLQTSAQICAILDKLLHRTDVGKQAVRLVGVSVSNLHDKNSALVQGQLDM